MQENKNNHINSSLYVKVNKHDEDINEIKRRLIAHNSEIEHIKGTIDEIKDDTNFIKQAITNAIIIAVAGGTVTFIYNLINTSGGS